MVLEVTGVDMAANGAARGSKHAITRKRTQKTCLPTSNPESGY